jgi:hypothetical protein
MNFVPLKNNIMKKNLRILFIAILFLAVPLFILAQSPPHPNGGNIPGAGNDPVGGGAAIGSGLSIMIAMGAAYAARRYYQMHRNKQVTVIG